MNMRLCLTFVVAVTLVTCAVPRRETATMLQKNDFREAGGQANGQGRPVPAVENKYDLWRQDATLLRGANIWQKRTQAGKIDNSCLRPELKAQAETGRLKKDEPIIEPWYDDANVARLAGEWKANYLNLSLPGLFSEKGREVEEQVRDEAGKLRKRKVRKYDLDPLVKAELERWLRLAERNNLFLVVAYRTGPERNEEKVFGGKSREPSVMFREDAKGFADAREGWKEMWKETARMLREHPNVIGYDLMVEPDVKGQGRLWTSLAVSLIEAIRSEDAKTPILVEAPDDAQPENLGSLDYASIDPRNEYQLVYCVHQYEPDPYTQHNEDHDAYSCQTGKSNEKDLSFGTAGTLKEKIDSLAEAFAKIRRWREGAQAFYRTKQERDPGIRETRVALAVNEFGVARWAGTLEAGSAMPTSRSRDRSQPTPHWNADTFLSEEFRLLETHGFNHAVWKWDPDCCMGDDAFNFRHGRLPTIHNEREADNLISEVILRNWRENRIDVAETLRHFKSKGGTRDR